MAAELASGSTATAAAAPFISSRKNGNRPPQAQLLRYYSRIGASNSNSNSMDEKNKKDKSYKQLGIYSLRKRIQDTVIRAEMLAPAALELEEAQQIKQEELIRHCNLWDDLAESNELLNKLADTTRVVDALKDLSYKAEEAKLITQLAERDAINYRLFKQAYNASLDVGKILDKYEISKLLRGPYEMEGACLVIKAGSEGRCSEIWAEKLLRMYTKWAEKQGCRGRIVEKHPSKNGGISCATIEFEIEYAYGYLLGERGVHCMISSQNGSALRETSLASVDVIPLFLDAACDLQINDEELIISPSSSPGKKHGQKHTVHVQHIPTGICFQSSGERNQFGNKIKALDRLKAKLLVTTKEQGVPDVSSIEKDEIVDIWRNEIRRYVTYPNKLVEDVKTGIQLPGLNCVLDGDIGPLVRAHINSRQGSEVI